MRNLLQMKEQKQILSTRDNISSLQERNTTKKNPSSNKKKDKKSDCTVTKYFGLVLGHAVDAGSPGNSRRWRRRHKRCNNQRRSSGVKWHFPPLGFVIRSSWLIGSFVVSKGRGKNLQVESKCCICLLQSNLQCDKNFPPHMKLNSISVKTKDGPFSDYCFVHKGLPLASQNFILDNPHADVLTYSSILCSLSLSEIL